MITVIIPAYNADKTIRQCLQSVLNQTGSFEIVLADDGSTDSTLQIAAEYADRVRILRLPHGGVSAARNAGLAAAKGEWVLFLDSDDALLPDAMEKFKLYMSDGVDAVCGRICRGNEKTRSSGKVLSIQGGHDLLDFVLADPTNYLTIHAWAFRRKENMPCFDSALRIGEDSDWVLRFLDIAQRVVFIPVPVYSYTVSADSTVHKWRNGQDQDFLRMLEKLGRGSAGEEKNWPLFVLANYLLILTHVVFHPNNPESIAERFETERQLRSVPIIRSAFADAKLLRMGKAKAVVLWCLKHGWVSPAYIAIKYRQMQNRKRAET